MGCASTSHGASICKNADEPQPPQPLLLLQRYPIPTCRGFSAASQRAVAALVDSGSANSAARLHREQVRGMVQGLCSSGFM